MKLHNFASPDAPYGQDIQGYADVSLTRKKGGSLNASIVTLKQRISVPSPNIVKENILV